MVNPSFAGGKPTMFICGNDARRKRTVDGILDQFGWETEDMGAAEAARAIEPLCMLWCIPGFLRTTGRTRSSCCANRRRSGAARARPCGGCQPLPTSVGSVNSEVTVTLRMSGWSGTT